MKVKNQAKKSLMLENLLHQLINKHNIQQKHVSTQINKLYRQNLLKITSTNLVARLKKSWIQKVKRQARNSIK